MPYIATDKVKEIRTELKETFPELKLSVLREHYSCIEISIMEAKDPAWAEYEGGYVQVNHFYIPEHYKNPVVQATLLKIVEIAKREQTELVFDGDYGSVPNYYIHINIGKWDRPFTLIKK
jgi:hypothetical protein